MDATIEAHHNFSNMTNTTANASIDVNVAVTYAMASTVSVISLLSIILNLIVIAVFIRTPNIRTPFNYYLLNLSFIDLIVALLDMPFFVGYTFNGTWPFGANMCAFFLYVDYVFTCATTNAVAIISLDRLCAVFFPVFYREKRSAKVSFVVIGILWAYLHAILLPYVIIDRTAENLDPTACFIDLPAQHDLGLFVQFVIYWMPLVVIAVSYCLICAKLLLRNSKRVGPARNSIAMTHTEHSHAPSHNHTAVTTTSSDHADSTAKPTEIVKVATKHRKHNKEARLYLALSWLTLFVICFWTPVDTYFTLGIFDKRYEDFLVYAIVICLQYSTCLVNPIVYHYSIPEIKHAVEHFLRCH